MDIFLILCMIVVFVILIVIGVYFIIHYQHPDDHNDAYAPKFIVLFGFVIAGCTVLLLPLDVANGDGYPGCAGYDTNVCGGLNMIVLWNIMFWLIPIWVFIMIPFATFYYEADDGMLMAGTAYAPNAIRKSRVAQALVYQGFVFIIVGIFITVLYLAFSTTHIPIQQYNSPTSSTSTSNTNDDYSLAKLLLKPYDIDPQISTSTNTNTTTPVLFTTSLLSPMGSYDENYRKNVTRVDEITLLSMQVSLGTFLAALLAWLGWFLFAFFGGIGLAAIPLDLLLLYTHRPKHMDASEFAEVQVSLRERTNELVDIGELIKIEREQKAVAGILSPFATYSLDSETRKAAREERQVILGFKQAVYLLEEDVEQFQAVATNMQSYNPLTPYAGLLFGTCATIISVIWFIHIAVYVFPPQPLAPFLNNYFQWFDTWFPLFSVVSVAIFTFYLLLAAVKGAFKVGLRLLCLHIHPMKVNKTYMSSFLFNIGLVLLCALPVVQFSQLAFSDYAKYATIRQIYGIQIQYLEFFQWFWRNKIFVYTFFAMTFLTTIYLARKPKDQATQGHALRDRLRSHQSSTVTGTDNNNKGGGSVMKSNNDRERAAI